MCCKFFFRGVKLVSCFFLTFSREYVWQSCSFSLFNCWIWSWELFTSAWLDSNWCCSSTLEFKSSSLACSRSEIFSFCLEFSFSKWLWSWKTFSSADCYKEQKHIKLRLIHTLMIFYWIFNCIFRIQPNIKTDI